ncbi:MAG: hypothetical protein SNH27_14655 [Rikenellaceae bacterium]
MKTELKINAPVIFADYIVTAMLDNEGNPTVRVEADKGRMVIREDRAVGAFDLCSYQSTEAERVKSDVKLGESLVFDDCVITALLDDLVNPILRVQAEKGRVVVCHSGSTKIFDIYSYKS